MRHTFALASVLIISLLAFMAPATAAPDCSGLAAARASARTAAAPLGYDVFDMDGDQAIAFEKGQDVPESMLSEHLTVMSNPQTARQVALLNNGPKCAFSTVASVLAPHLSAINAALDFLHSAR